MYLLYLDDAGSPGNAAEDYFVLGSVAVFEAQIDWFNREIDKIASPFNPNSPEDVEMHASAIFSRRDDPWKKLDINDARGILKSVLTVVSKSYNSTCLFACAVHKKSYPAVDPVALAFEDVCQRFEMFLSKKRHGGDQQRGMLVLDNTTHETSLRNLSREFRKTGTRWGNIRNIADTPFFVDSKASRLVQIADHVAYAVLRRYNAGDAQYMDIIAHRFDEENGVIHGLCHKYNERTCTCPVCLSRRISRSGQDAPAR